MAILVQCICGVKNSEKALVCRGCGRSLKGLKGKLTYWIDFRDSQGVRHQKKIGPSKKIAELALKEVQIKIAKREHLGIVEEKKITFSDFCNLYFKEYISTYLSPSSQERAKIILFKHLTPYFSGYLSKIKRADIEGYLAKRREQVQPATVNREFSRLRHMFNFALARGLIKENPCAGIKELKEPPGRVRYLTLEEISKLPELFKAMPEWLKPIVTIALYTGLRRSEILSLKWSNINLKERLIRLERTKNNEARVAYITKPVYKALLSIPRRIDTDLLFPDITPSMVSKAFLRACKSVGIFNFHFHDLRHNFGSYLAMSGHSIKTIQQLLGHKDIRMTLRYAHLSPEHLRAAAEGLFKVIGNQMETIWRPKEKAERKT